MKISFRAWPSWMLLSAVSAFALLALAAPKCYAATFYVSPSGSDSNSGTQAAPVQTIQQGINLTLDGDTVVITAGYYYGTGNVDLDFDGKNITVTSQSGPAYTTIDCGGSGTANHRGFDFHSGETNAVVSGFTIQNGYISGIPPNGSDVYNGGGIAVDSGSIVTVSNCIITGNTLTGTFTTGGGVYNNGRLTLTNCVLTDNTASGPGGEQYGGDGGGIYNSGTVTLTNCSFTGNTASSGSGPDNGTYGGLGGGISNSGTATLVNNIFYGDMQSSGGEIDGSVTSSYCDIQGGYPGNNINANPLFIFPSLGNLHLGAGSPCIGRGTHTGAPLTDMDGTARRNPPSMGAYEGGLPLTVPGPYHTIQAALDAAQSGQTVTVSNGTYTGPGNVDLIFGGRSITLTSASGDPTQTIINCGGYASSDGTGNHRGIILGDGETSAVVSGLTIENGYASPEAGGEGGGIYNADQGTTIRNCILRNNQADSGGGIYNSGLSGTAPITVINCVLTGNHAVENGGGICNSISYTVNIINCSLSGNLANNGAGVFNDYTYNGTFYLINDILYGDAGGNEISFSSGDNAYGAAISCDVQGGIPASMNSGGNISANPLFVNSGGGDLHLKPGSPCVGTGTTSEAPAADLDGNPRPNPPSIGAYEEITHAYLLWSNTSGAASLWTISLNGTHSISPTYGPYSGWKAIALSSDPNGLTHLLWVNTNGAVAVWNVAANGTFKQHGYGPFAGWRAVSLSTGSDGSSHLLWEKTDGTTSLWKLNTSSGAYTYANYGPFAGWTAKAVASGAMTTDLLWQNINGQASGWKIAANGTYQHHEYGPYPQWAAPALSVGPNDGAHLLWDKSDGNTALWSVDFGSGAFTQTGYGPFAGWAAKALATGPDGMTHLLWNHAPDSQASVWKVGTGGSYTHAEYGPYSGWSAIAIADGP